MYCIYDTTVLFPLLLCPVVVFPWDIESRYTGSILDFIGSHGPYTTILWLEPECMSCRVSPAHEIGKSRRGADKTLYGDGDDTTPETTARINPNQILDLKS